MGNKKKMRIAVLLVAAAVLLLGGCGVFSQGEASTSEPAVLDYRQELVLEAGEPLPGLIDFLVGAAPREPVRFGEEYSNIDTSVPGVYPVVLCWQGCEYMASLKVVDTVAPVGVLRSQSVFGGAEIPAAESFVEEMTDVTAVTVSYEAEPDMMAEGEQTVVLLLTDTSGNTARLETTLTVIFDKTPPVITGVKNLVVYAGDAVSYRSGITVTDDYDEAPSLMVDSSTVDLTTPGVYEITYGAMDKAGNVTVESAVVTVFEKMPNFVDPEEIYGAVDAVLEKITTEDMTDLEKLQRVYCWVKIHMTYSYHYHNPSEGDWVQGGYDLLVNRSGDCYSFYALNKLMLERLGIPNIDVYKVKNAERDSMHYWLMVSPDGGDTFYHFDNVWSSDLCLASDAKLDAFSKEHRNCFNRDKSLYPETPDKSYPQGKLPWEDPVLRGTKN